MPGNRVTIDFLTAASVITGSGPALPANVEETRAMDGIGNFAFELAATDPKAALATHGAQVKIYHEDEGWTFWGIIDQCEQVLAEDGSCPFRVTGASIGRQLTFANTKLGRSYGISGGQTLANVVGGDSSGNPTGSFPEASALLRGTGWNRGSTDTPAAPGGLLYSGRLDGLTIWDAIGKVAQVFRMHVRENVLARTIDLGAFGTNPNGISFENMPHPNPGMRAVNQKIFPIKTLSVVSKSTDLWNRIYPTGGGEGNGALDLSYSTRTVGGGFSYDINSGGFEFNPSTTGGLYSIKDATSIAAYGERVRCIQFKDILPMSNSAVGWRDAANALYDLASTYLVRNKDPQTVYRVTVANMRNLTAAGAELVRCGDIVHLRYNGVVNDLTTGARLFLNVDTNVTILKMTRTTRENGAWDWAFDISTVDRVPTSVADQLVSVFNNVYQIAYQPQHYVFQQSFFLGRRSMDKNHPTTLLANLDGNVGKVLKGRLTFTIGDVRTNASKDVSTIDNGAYQNVIATLGANTGAASDTGAHASNNQALAHQHTENAAATYTQNASTVAASGTPSAHDHNTNPHNHPEAATTTYLAAGSSHTHQTLGLVITDNSVSPYSCAVTVNGHAITGSPFTTKGSFNVDVTSFLQDANGLVGSQINTIIFDNAGSAGQGLMDVEAQLAVTATISSIYAT